MEVLTVNEYAEQFKVHRETVRRWIREGHLRVVRLGHKRLGSPIRIVVSDGKEPASE